MKEKDELFVKEHVLVHDLELVKILTIKKKHLTQLKTLNISSDMEIIGIVESYMIIVRKANEKIGWIHYQDYIRFLRELYIVRDEMPYKEAEERSFKHITSFPQIFAD